MLAIASVFGRDRKCLVSVEISPIYQAVKELLLLPVYRPPLLFPVVGDGTVETAVPINGGDSR